MIIAIGTKLCSLWYVLCVHDVACGLGSFWSLDTCYEPSLFYNLWTWLIIVETWNFVHCWNWQLACVGYVEIPDAIIYMLGCYVSCFESFTCLDNSDIFVLKFEIQVKWWEKIEMRLYCPTSRYRDGFQLHIWMNLSLVVDDQNHCFELLIVFDIGSTWLKSKADSTDNLSHTHVLTNSCVKLRTLIKLKFDENTSLKFVFDMMCDHWLR